MDSRLDIGGKIKDIDLDTGRRDYGNFDRLREKNKEKKGIARRVINIIFYRMLGALMWAISEEVKDRMASETLMGWQIGRATMVGERRTVDGGLIV
jgi:hypothetical protein